MIVPSGDPGLQFYAVFLKKKHVGAARTVRWLDTLSMTPIIDGEAALVVEGAAIAGRCQISYWDGALVAACNRCGAETLFSENLSHRQRYGAVRIIDPFREH